MDPISLIGTAELDIRAVGDKFQADINRVAKPGLQSAGREADKTARGMSKSFGAMWSAFGAQSQGALGPVSMVVDQIQTAVASISKNSSLAAKGMVAAGVVGGVGIGLQAAGSGELAAQNQLRLSVADTGAVYDDYSDKVEKAIEQGERHGKNAEDTLRTLNQLTISSHSVNKALTDYNFVLGAAAERNVPLLTMARMVGVAYAGNSRALKSLGIDLTAGQKASAAAAAADKAHAAALEKLKTARQNLADTEARINASRQGHAATQDQIASATARVGSAEAAVATARWKNGAASPQLAAAEARLAAAQDRLTKMRGQGHGTTALTVSQEIELRKAHDAVTEAQKNLTTSTRDMTQAHKDAKGAVSNVDQAIAQHKDIIKQADAQAATFSGHVHHYWAEAEDDVAHFGNQWGGTVTAIAAGMLVTSTVAGGMQSVWARMRGGSKVAQEEVTADAEGSAAASVEATDGMVTGVSAGFNRLAVNAAEAWGRVTAEARASAEGTMAAWRTADTEVTAMNEAVPPPRGGIGGGGALVPTGGVGGGGGFPAVGVVGTLALSGVGAMPDQRKAPLSGKLAISAAEVKALHGLPPAQVQAALQDYYTSVGSGYHPDPQKLAAWRSRWDPSMGLATNGQAYPSDSSRAKLDDLAAMHGRAGASGVDPQLLSLMISIHGTLLQIQSGTTGTRQNTHDIHQVMGRSRPSRGPILGTLGGSPELATLD